MNTDASFDYLCNETFGANCTEEKTHFKIMALNAQKVSVALYDTAFVQYRDVYPMENEGPGIWSLTLLGDFHEKCYTYLLDQDGVTLEVLDPYALSAGIDTKRGALIDLTRTNPEGFVDHMSRCTFKNRSPLIYELHLRDFTVDPESGILHKGKYLGLAESGTEYHLFPTGLDHLLDFGVTHVHILPVADFGSVKDLDPEPYNWGYDPVLYNAPEGSYSTDPKTPSVRIIELKKMIQTLHENGLKVVVDVVYNHTFEAEFHAFNRLAPHVFYRERDSVLTNGSGVGSELQTEHPLVAQFILNSLLFWLREYAVDGFRIDLLGLYDVDFVRRMSRILRHAKPDILIYGEPWIGGDSGLSPDRQFLKGKQKHTGVALFNDDFRNAIKGDNDGTGLGLVQGHGHMPGVDAVRSGIAGSIGYSDRIKGFAENAYESINYVSSHDNLILRDKLEYTMVTFNKDILMDANRLALTIVLTAYGIPFIQCGTELYRSKRHLHNTFNAGDAINHLKWRNKEKYYVFYAYLRAVVEFRSRYRLFDEGSPFVIQKQLNFIQTEILSYTVTTGEYSYWFHHNYLNDPFAINVEGDIDLFFFNQHFDVEGLRKSQEKEEYLIEPKSSLIYRKLNTSQSFSTP